MLKMNEEMLKEIFGDLNEVCERFNLESLSVNEFAYDSDRDEFEINFSMTTKSSVLADMAGIEETDLKEFIEVMAEEDE